MGRPRRFRGNRMNYVKTLIHEIIDYEKEMVERAAQAITTESIIEPEKLPLVEELRRRANINSNGTQAD
jgi:hypothetical protein